MMKSKFDQRKNVTVSYKSFLIKLTFSFSVIFFFSTNSYSNSSKRSPWPIKGQIVIGNLFHTPLSIRGEIYFHHGIDVLADPGTQVYAVSPGIGQLFFDSQNTDYRTGIIVTEKSGKTWVYLHLNPSTIPSKFDNTYFHVRVKRGELLGAVTGAGNTFPHLHIELWEGKRPIDPMLYLKLIKDIVAPRIKEIVFFKNASDQYFEKKNNKFIILSGNIDIVANITDLIPPSLYELTPYEIYYSVKSLDKNNKAKIPKTLSYRFKTLPGVNKVRPASGYNVDPLIYDLKGKIFEIFKYNKKYSTKNRYLNYKRNYYFVVTNGFNGKVDDKNGCWRTKLLNGKGKPVFPNGKYRVTIYAKDYYGNEATRFVDVILNNSFKKVSNYKQ